MAAICPALTYLRGWMEGSTGGQKQQQRDGTRQDAACSDAHDGGCGHLPCHLLRHALGRADCIWPSLVVLGLLLLRLVVLRCALVLCVGHFTESKTVNTLMLTHPRSIGCSPPPPLTLLGEERAQQGCRCLCGLRCVLAEQGSHSVPAARVEQQVHGRGLARCGQRT